MDENNAIITSAEQAKDIDFTAGGAVTNSGITNSGIAITVSGMEMGGGRKMPRGVMYVITDKSFGEFYVTRAVGEDGSFYGRNPWWVDKGKVDRLISAFKEGHLIKHARFYAGISLDEWREFSEAHPDFARVKEICESHQTFAAVSRVNAGIREDPTLAFRYLERTHPKFSPKLKIESEQPLMPTMQVGAIQINQNVDTTKIEELLTAAIQVMLAERGGSSIPGLSSGQDMEKDDQGGGA